MNLDGIKYTGVFLEQQDESLERARRMTFSIVSANRTAWSVSKEVQE